MHFYVPFHANGSLYVLHSGPLSLEVISTLCNMTLAESVALCIHITFFFITPGYFNLKKA